MNKKLKLMKDPLPEDESSVFKFSLTVSYSKEGGRENRPIKNQAPSGVKKKEKKSIGVSNHFGVKQKTRNITESPRVTDRPRPTRH